MNRRRARWAALLLALPGALSLGYAAFLYFDGVIHQWRYERIFERKRTGAVGSVNAAEEPVARIAIPRLAVSAMVLDGVGDETLRRAVGRVPGTATPGATGNVVLAAHRDTFFRPLRDIRRNDEIRVETVTGGVYRYVVESTRVVEPDEVSVLRPTSEPTLTLLTCYPFEFVGPAPQRFVVTARQVRRSSAAASNSRGD